MRLNTIKPAAGANKPATRVGRGIGSGKGKTCGRGHKGQRARAGGFHKVGFEGGQMPLQRRLPKFGFVSRVNMHTAEIRLRDLNRISAEIINLATLRAAGLINSSITKAKIILAGEIIMSIHVSGITVTKGAKLATESAGGKVEA